MDKYPFSLFNLKNKVTVITGGQGMLGSHYARTLAEAGATVAVLDVKAGDSDYISKLKKDNLPVHSFRADLLNESELGKVFEEIVEKLGTPTILVNNAGLGSIPNAPASENGPFEFYEETIWDSMIDSHVKSAFFTSKIFLKKIKEKKLGGSIINISSTYGLVSPDQSLYDFRRKDGTVYFKPIGYTVAKSAMIGFTKWLAEYAAPSVRVNALAPGGVYTDDLHPDFVKGYENRTPLRRMANADDYNGSILFLASEASAYMTGSIMIVDGGWTVK